MSAARFGVLALQGDFREHAASLERLGVQAHKVRTLEELDACDALVIPGGESTAMLLLAESQGILEPLRTKIASGLPVLGTCAGMVLLAREVLDGKAGQQTLGGLDIVVRRNAFGGQIHSFETDLDFAGLDTPVHAVFIRAPWVEELGPDVEVLASLPTEAQGDRIVAVRQGSVWATSFHPEVNGDDRIHKLFVDHVLSATAN